MAYRFYTMKQNPKTLSQNLAQTIMNMAEEPLPSQIIQTIKICFLDYMACCVSGADSYLAHTVVKTLNVMGSGESLLLGRSEKGSPFGAAFFNGTVSTAEELDDSHRYVGGFHPSATVLPALIAAVERKKISSNYFMKAMLCGYEVGGRICKAIERGHRAKGFHSTSTVGPMAAATSVCISMQGDSQVLAHALGIAGSSCSGLFAFLDDGAMGKYTHPGRASAEGLLAASLALKGMTGPSTILESKEGFLQAYSNFPDKDPITDLFDESYEISNTYHKVHSACGHAYPTIDAVLALKKEVPQLGDLLEYLEVKVYMAATGLKRDQVKSITEARFSIPFLVGMIIEKGSLTKRDWIEEVIENPKIRKLASLVEVVEDADLTKRFPDIRSAKITAKLKDGRVISHKSDSPFGMPENPVQWSDIVEKFHACTDKVLSDKSRNTVLEMVQNLEQVSSMEQVFQAFKQ